MEHMFPALKSFASKEYKFQQRKSMELVLARYPEEAASGVCFGAVMMWVKEKLTTTGSLWHGSQAKAFSPNGDAEVHQRNKYTMRAAGEFHQYYKQHGAGDLGGYMGLREVFSTFQPTVRPDRGHQPEVQMFETLARAGQELPAGHAIVVEVGLYNWGNQSYAGGHAIGMYRSRGNHLYFFDPNIGVYQVRDIAGFVRAWLDGCRDGRGWSVTPLNDARRTWFYCFAR
jgi:hypothetical protein